MSSLKKQKTIFQNLYLDDVAMKSASAVTPNTAALCTLLSQGLVLRRARLELAALVVTIDNTLDYGSTKLCDLPNTGILFVGAVCSLAATGTGGVSSIAAVDVALGTVATASTTFATTGSKNLMAKVDVTSGGVAAGQSVAAETNILLAPGASNAVYLNVVDVISTDGTVVFTGFVDILYFDVGKP